MSRSDTATGMLREEHRLILQVAGVLDRMLLGLGTDEALDFDAVDECVAFFRRFADLCHHGKEEDLLFPELQARGMPRDEGPIAVMLYEHRLGRGFVGKMAEALPGARAGDADAVASLTQAARGYVDLIRGHIFKEDNVLFNMADRMVHGPACRALCDAYGVVCERRFEGQTKDELEELAAGLVERYPGD